MVAQPWKFFAEIEPDHEYLVMSTFLPLEGSGMRRAFGRDVRRVERQLASSEGLVGYSLRVKFWRRHYWTLSVWEDERSLIAFSEAAPHRDVMAPRDWRLSGFKSVHWRVRGTEIPPTWRETLDRLGSGQRNLRDGRPQ
ncbi:MAG: hypothetical protein ACE5I4_02690 [Thermoplasmata archaeon]